MTHTPARGLSLTPTRAPCTPCATDVDLQELVGGMKEMGLNLSDDEFLAFFHDLDANGDGAITRKEFTDAITKAVANDPSGMK